MITALFRKKLSTQVIIKMKRLLKLLLSYKIEQNAIIMYID
jgi:hypothetical protein